VSWYAGIAAIAATGAGIVLDEVLLDGARGQERLQAMLGSLEVLWVGVHCEREVAVAREATRPDRIPGMAAFQATVVHVGVAYDVIVDTSDESFETCAAQILSSVVSRSENSGS
jgi:chloramphenicol 3-O phosphotransferase